MESMLDKLIDKRNEIEDRLDEIEEEMEELNEEAKRLEAQSDVLAEMINSYEEVTETIFADGKPCMERKIQYIDGVPIVANTVESGNA